jgi:hypothetical protein
MPFDGMLDDNEDIRDVLEYISESLTRSTLTTRDAERREMALQAPAERTTDTRRMQRDPRTDLRTDPREARYYQDQDRRRARHADDFEG